jgi:hypothetical protein
MPPVDVESVEAVGALESHPFDSSIKLTAITTNPKRDMALLLALL